MKVIIALVLLFAFAAALSLPARKVCERLPEKYQKYCKVADRIRPLLRRRPVKQETESDFLAAVGLGIKAFNALRGLRRSKKNKKPKQQAPVEPESDFLAAVGLGMKAFNLIRGLRKKKNKKPKQQAPAEPESDFFSLFRKFMKRRKNRKPKRPQPQPEPQPQPQPQPAPVDPTPLPTPVETPVPEPAAPATNEEPQDDVEEESDADRSRGDAIAAAIIRIVGGSTTPKGRCAQYSREAIEAATGFRLERKTSAKDYGSSLLKVGFRVVSGSPRNGDVAIFQAIPNHPHGHMQIFTNQGWFSDFKQRDQYAGPRYRNSRAPFTLYRLD